MSSNTFVPGINNSSFDYDARFQRLMDVLGLMVSEIKGLRQEVSQLRQEVHSENDYRARRPWQDKLPSAEPVHADLPHRPREVSVARSVNDEDLLGDMRF